jgi:hypothetical protein
MDVGAGARQMLEQEARALLTRLARVRSFALYETMVPAAAVSLEAQTAIERCLEQGRRTLRQRVGEYLRWLRSPEARRVPPAEAQRRFTFLRLQFNNVLAQFDTFADVMTQRSEHETGVWLSGLDVVAAEALTLPAAYFKAPPVVCYLDRGPGAAIRRARTRLPGGSENPVAIIRVPRERMIGAGIASSLVHEVGHQGAALLDLVTSLRLLLRGLQQGAAGQRFAWHCWDRWISEIVADLWAVARIGIAATYGLMSVVSLPRYFVFRLNLHDPHPPPWIRVKLSYLMGNALYPDPQWGAVARLWASFYPTTGLTGEQRQVLTLLEESLPAFVALLVEHRPAALRGSSLREVLSMAERTPACLRASYSSWRTNPAQLRAVPPSLAFAAIGQARADGTISPEAESHLLGELLTHWALRSTLDRSAICATPGRSWPASTVARLAPA